MDGALACMCVVDPLCLPFAPCDIVSLAAHARSHMLTSVHIRTHEYTLHV